MAYRLRLMPLVAALLALSTAPLAMAEKYGREKAVLRTHKDPKLKWEPCPSYFPKGCQVAPLHGDMDEQDSDFYFKMPSSATIVGHWHPTEERIVAVSGTFHVTYAGQKTLVVEPGQFVYAPPELSHTGVCVTEPECVLYIHLRSPVESERTEVTAE